MLFWGRVNLGVQKLIPVTVSRKDFAPVYNPSHWAVYTLEKEQDTGNMPFNILEPEYQFALSSSHHFSSPSKKNWSSLVEVWCFAFFLENGESVILHQNSKRSWTKYAPLDLFTVTLMAGVKGVTGRRCLSLLSITSSSSRCPPLLHLSAALHLMPVARKEHEHSFFY